MPSPSLISLDDAGHFPGLGGKVRGLRWLVDQGMPVPRTFVCLPHAFSTGAPNGADWQVLKREVKEIIEPGRLYAIRSAANLEDGHDASFAGQFSSVLNVQGVDAVMAAVAEAYASSSGLNVESYLGRKGLSTVQLQMAVIIQEMVEPLFSGVSFSRNPITGFDEVIVEGVNGAGTALLQEGATPFRWVNKWGDWTAKPEDGGLEIAVVERLVQDTSRLAESYGQPVDLEWVYDGREIHWLQVRPITELGDINIYSNRIAREVLPGIIKPLVWSVNIPGVNSAWCDIFTELIGPNDIDPNELAKAFFHRAYFNMGVIGQVLEAVGMPRATLEVMMGLEGGNARPNFKPGKKVVPHLPRMIRFAVDKLRFSRSVKAFIPEIKEAYAAFDLENVSTLADEALRDDINRLAVLYRKIAYYNIVVPLLARLYDALLQRRLDNQGIGPEAFDLMDGFDDIEAYEPHTHLTRLHETYSKLSKAMRQQIRTANFETFMTLPSIRPFQDAVEDFLVRFGHLSDSGNDFSYSPWRENKDFILQLITEFNGTGSAETRMKRGDLKLSLLQRPAFDFVYRRARLFRYYREAVSSQYTYGYGLFRVYFLEIGRRFVERGLIWEQDDIFYLYLEEVLAGLGQASAEHSYVDDIANRRKMIEAIRDLALPEVIFGDQPPPLETFDEGKSQLKGVPTSRGYYQGPVKVIKSVTEFERLNDGDVLVIPYSDIAWTPLFTRAGAVVAESGGMLSHSSIVAREYGLPSVVSVNDACRIPDGTIVTVDGFNGLVLLQNDEAQMTGNDLSKIPQLKQAEGES